MNAYVWLVLGVGLLILGADALVRGASALAKRYQISDRVVGLTVVAFGTSMPEMVVSVIASYQGNSAIAVGNVLGSNIANIFLILGSAALFSTLPIRRNTLRYELPISIAAVLLLPVLAGAFSLDANATYSLSRWDGVGLLVVFALFIGYSVASSRSDMGVEETDIPVLPMRKVVLFVLAGVGALFLGGRWTIQGAVLLATEWGLSERFVGLTIVAIGTSLPELVTSAYAAYRKNTDIAVGNVVGSNIFNVLWILGLSAVVRPLNYLPASQIDVLVVVGASVLLLLFTRVSSERKIGWLSGLVFLLSYAGYIYYLWQQV